MPNRSFDKVIKHRSLNVLMALYDYACATTDNPPPNFSVRDFHERDFTWRGLTVSFNVKKADLQRICGANSSQQDLEYRREISDQISQYLPIALGSLFVDKRLKKDLRRGVWKFDITFWEMTREVIEERFNKEWEEKRSSGAFEIGRSTSENQDVDRKSSYEDLLGTKKRPIINNIPQCETRDLDSVPVHFANCRVDRTDAKEKDKECFHGREKEIDILCRQVLGDRCQLLSVQAMGGVGKTSLILELDKKIQDEFKYVLWKELSNAPPIQETLYSILNFISMGQENDQERTESEFIRLIISYLKQNRCLIVLDNMESVMCTGEQLGLFRNECKKYDELISEVVKINHESCLIITSREKPKIVSNLSSTPNFDNRIFSLELKGLGEEAKEIINSKNLIGNTGQKEDLIKICNGNPLILHSVCAWIATDLNNNIQSFLDDANNQGVIYGDPDRILEKHFDRLSQEEKTVIFWLAISREPLTSDEIIKNVFSEATAKHTSLVRQAIKSLIKRFLIKTILTIKKSKYSLDNIVIEYVTSVFIDEMIRVLVPFGLEALSLV
jgi:hypothetical protein